MQLPIAASSPLDDKYLNKVHHQPISEIILIMGDELCHLTKGYGQTYVSPKDVALDRIFKKNLLQFTKIDSSHWFGSTAEPRDTSVSNYHTLPWRTYGVLKATAKKCCTQQKRIDSATIDTLIDILVSKITLSIRQDSGKDHADEFSCPSCFELLFEPVTLVCGHTFCKTCICKSSQCRECKSNLGEKSSINGNVLLTSILQKWHPTEYVGRSLIEEGDKLVKNNQIQQAISKYMDAMECAPNSHVASCKRARAFAILGNLEGALEDALHAETLAKWWPEVHFIKGDVFAAMKKEDESLLSYLTCLSLDPTNSSAKLKAKTIVTKVMSEEMKDDNPGTPARKRKRDSDDFALTWSHSQRSVTSPSPGKHGASSTSRNQFGVDHAAADDGCSTSCGTASEDVLITVLNELESDAMVELGSDDGLPKDTSKESADAVQRRVVDQSLIEASDFECSLCMRLYYLPVCTPCGHTFCRECIERCIDHSMPCPLCKSTISNNIVNQKLSHPAIDASADTIIKRFLPSQHKERVHQEDEEIRQLKQSIPIFVCTLAFPSVLCPLHIYEPRYRLMLRRVLDIHDNEFGICKPLPDNRFSEIGTILKVKNITFLPDGRSVVESIGHKRFEVVEYSSNDGYDSAKVRYIVDQQVEKEADLAVLKKLLVVVYQNACEWFASVDSPHKDQIKIHFGELPQNDDSQGDDGPTWTWWMLAVLPVEDKVKMSILGKKLLRERLLLLHRVLSYLKKRREKSI